MKVSDIYIVTVTATRERFMEKTLHDTSVHYVLADSREKAIDHVFANLKRGGWDVLKVECRRNIVQDIREEDK